MAEETATEILTQNEGSLFKALATSWGSGCAQW